MASTLDILRDIESDVSSLLNEIKMRILASQVLESNYDKLYEKIDTLYDAIAHGDEEHRAWLKVAMEAHFKGEPVPPPRVKKDSDKPIVE